MARARVVKKYDCKSGMVRYLIQRKVLFFWVDCDYSQTLERATEVAYVIARKGKVLIDIENGKILDKDDEQFAIMESDEESTTSPTKKAW